MLKRKILIASLFAPLAILFLSAQISAPPVYSPKLGIGGAPPTANGDLRVYGNFRLDGTCTGCPTTAPAGSDTQVQFNNAGAFGGDAGLTYNSTTDALSVTGSVSVAGSALSPPGGSNTQVQFNNSGVLGGDAGLTYNSATDALTAGSFVGSGSSLTSLPETNGSFTVTFADGCTVDHVYTFTYRKVGNIVSLQWGNGSPNVCVGDSISYDTNSLAPVPSEIRPTTNNVRTAALVVTDNSVAHMGYMQILTSGNIIMSRCIAQGGAATGNFACSNSLWTTANNRGFEAGQVTYNLSQ